MPGDNASQPLLASPRKSTKSRSKIILISAAVVFLGTSLYLASLTPSVNQAAVFQQTATDNHDIGSVQSPGISEKTLEHGIQQCSAIEARKTAGKSSSRREKNPRAVSNTPPLLIRNGYIWVGNSYLDGYDILVDHGLIQKVEKNIETLPEYDIIDAKSRVVTPGIVDMHSHIGVESLPMLEATTDGNEGTNPNTPYVRALEAFNPSDPALGIVMSGGVTTSLALPGSGNLMGGEALAIKLRPVSSLSVEDMQVSAGADESEEKIWRYMKMACGENPKNSYGYAEGTMPLTRMGEGYLFRKWFNNASKLKNQQDDWCEAAERLNASSHHHQTTRLSTPFPEDLELESLVALLRGDTKLNIHCYEPHDLEAMVRHSLEYDFEITAFHHALKAWKVPEIIKRAKGNITIATFSDMWGYKFEAMDGNVRAAQILGEAGIPVAFKSDHPVLTAQDLAHEAAKAYHYGLGEHKALQSVTTIPASAMGLSHRIGSIAPGMDADIVIWERHPLRLGARPDHVIVDGIKQQFNSSFDIPPNVLASLNLGSPSDAKKDTRKDRAPIVNGDSLKLEDHGSKNPVTFTEACSPNTDSFVLRNIGKLFLAKNTVYDNTKALRKEDELYVIVENGTIVCSGAGCGRDKIDWPNKSAVFDLNGGYVLPGLISTGARIGLVEMISESSTHDGFADNKLNDPDLHKTITRAVDGLKFGTEHLEKPYRAGVLHSITQPLVNGDKVVAGVSVAFKIGAENTVLDSDDIIIKEEAALHFVLTLVPEPAKSEQIAGIRRLLVSNLDKDTNENVFARAAKGQLPVVIQTDDKDEIAQIIKMKQHIQSLQGGSVVRFVILGGAEAWLVADHLAAAQIPVVLAPPRCRPAFWGQRHCLSGKPMQDATGLDVLVAKGVLVGVASLDADDGYVRNLIWDAGWNLATNNNLTDADAVGFVSWNLAEIFGLHHSNGSPVGVLAAGQPAELVAYDGNPFEFGTQVQLVAGGGRRGVSCLDDVRQT
ncbi:hypothetical protein BC943DRAFT_290772 [Umbelopsis sp. AD052]|nr:hypothetical protein BC943DRAFT_290772 [Umbelopsis sp. AD052]